MTYNVAHSTLDEVAAVLKKLKLKNFTAFPDAQLEFAKRLNVIVGVNGVGKTHLLKLPYAAMATSVEEGRKRNGRPTKTGLQTRRWRVALHLEQPNTRSRLRPQPFEVANVLSRIRKSRKLKAVDPHPVILNRGASRPDVPWTVQ